jgi:hypothetical protein
MLKDNVLWLDNSGRSDFVRCPRYYFYAIIQGIRPRKGSTALRYGECWHILLENHYKGILQDDNVISAANRWRDISADQFFEEDYRTFEALVQSFLIYPNHFDYDPSSIKILRTERLFDHFLVKQGGYDIHFTGKIDMEVEMDGLTFIWENKTTSQPMMLQASRLHRDPQILGYTWAGKREHDSVEGCIVNLHQLSASKKRDGSGYGTLKIDFHRMPCVFTDRDLENWKESFLYTVRQIIYAYETDSWPMILDSCYQYGRCRYADLCEQNIPLGEIPEGFYLRPWDMRVPGQNVI